MFFRLKILAGFFSLLIISGLAGAATLTTPEANPYAGYRKVKIIATTYFAHRWSDYGRYKRVSKKGKRLGEYVALNFLPGGSLVMIPELFKTSKLEVADTLGKSGRARYKGKTYWQVDILRNKNEWIDDFDYPMDLYIVKYNKNGPVKNKQVRKNSRIFAN